MVHQKNFFWDFDNDSYAQNSEIIQTIRIQKNFFKIPIGKFFEKLSKSKKKNLCVPHMWYTIPHLWVKATTYVVYYTTYVVYYTTYVYSPEIPILLIVINLCFLFTVFTTIKLQFVYISLNFIFIFWYLLIHMTYDRRFFWDTL